VPSKVGEAHGRTAVGEIGRGGDEHAPRALKLSGYETRIRQFSDPERKVGPFSDQILVAIRHHEIDLEQRMLGEERRKQRHDAPDAIFRRQGDAQQAGETVGAARRTFRVVDREQGVAGASEQNFAGVGGGDLPRGADEELDAQAPLERRDGPRHRGLGQTEFAARLREASALDGAYEQGELLQPIIHTVRVVEAIKRGGGKAVAIQANVSKSADVKRLFAETKASLGAANVLVNNAGVFSFEPLDAVTEAEFHRQFDTNVLGTLLATQEAARSFNGDGGSVINISTISSINPVPNSVVYSASKSAIDSITKALAKELSDRKIRVNAIAPGMTATEGVKDLGITFEMAKAIGAPIPLGRLGQPDDIARVALFLASDQSSWLTGERISASGGQR
jgi:3-oxoacyl-[acyl-carrier protein] reductase